MRYRKKDNYSARHHTKLGDSKGPQVDASIGIFRQPFGVLKARIFLPTWESEQITLASSHVLFLRISLINIIRRSLLKQLSTEGSISDTRMKFNVQRSSGSMFPVLPFDIIVQIIDAVGENKDTNLLKELALVSHCFHQICSKHLFATVELHDADPERDVASSKNGFVKLLKSRPDVVKYIRKLTYKVGFIYSLQFPPTRLIGEDDLLSPILPNFLRTISRLNCLTISALNKKWDRINPSLTSAFIHLMQLPTINHIDLSYIRKFPMSSLIPSVNLLRLDLHNIGLLEEEIVVQLEMMPKIREFHTSESYGDTRLLLHAKRQDGRPAFNFMDLRRVSMRFSWIGDQGNIQYLLQNAKLLETLHLSVAIDQSLYELHAILSPIPHTLKVLDLTLELHYNFIPLRLAVFCKELEAMAGHTSLEALSFDVHAGPGGPEAEVLIGSIIQKVEKVLVKSGWSALRQVSFKFSIACRKETIHSEEPIRVNLTKLPEALQFLSDKYPNLSKLEFISTDSSPYYVVKCNFEFD